MRKTALLILLTLSLPVWGYPGDFREAEWGMTKEQVKAIEQARPGLGFALTREDLLFYHTDKTGILGLEASIKYGFDDGKLVLGQYQFLSIPHEKCKEIYDQIVENVSKKCGIPKFNIDNQTVTARIALWMTKGTVIELELRIHGILSPRLWVTYYSVEYWIEETFLK